jgi:hypothetical protein
MSKMKKILKYINSIPFGFTVKHYQTFGSSKKLLKDNALLSVSSWDELREHHPHFSIPENRQEWLDVSELKVVKDGQDKSLINRAKDVVSFLKKENIKSVFSAGCGGAGLEYQIKKNMSEAEVVCSEYSEKNVTSLKKVFLESNDIIVFDILKGDWNSVREKYIKNNSATLLMYRLDAGFTNTEWREIFEKIHKSGIENIIYIPTTFLTMLSLWNRKYREIKWFLKNEEVSFAGHLRTKKTFQSFWSGLYSEKDMEFGGLKGFVLKRIEYFYQKS